MNKQTPSLTSSEYALLGLLAAGPCHGYELHRKFADPDGIGLIWGVKISNMYAQLAKLAQRGLISGKLQENEQRPARTQYSLTPGGKQQFISWLHTPVQHPRDFRHDFFCSCTLYHNTSPVNLIHWSKIKLRLAVPGSKILLKARSLQQVWSTLPPSPTGSVTPRSNPWWIG